MPAQRPIPIDEHIPRLIEAVQAKRHIVLVAEPGAGKTTRVAPALIRAGLFRAPNDKLLMLQPRRMAARAAAARIAFEQAWKLGDQVGYQVRFERIFASHTPLRVVTEGILARRLAADPELSGFGCVILDEFHERSIHSDLSLAMLREARALRPDLRLVVMSATLDADPVADFLAGAAEVEVIHVPGRLFPVEVTYAGDSPAPIEERVADVLRQQWGSAALPRDAAEVHDEMAGRDILIFLPGVREIERTLRAISRQCAQHGYEAIALHGSLTRQEQDRAVGYDPAALPRVICATNIAQTSLTLPGVRLVIDSGLVRQAGYDPARGIENLSTTRISKASAEQRRGRAGRLAAGRCIRLWSKMTQHRLADFDVPEVMRIDLAEACLAVRAWGADPTTFKWFQAPEPRLLAAAQDLLELLGAVAGGRLTPLGRELVRLPLHPREARLLMSAPAHLVAQAAAVAALLSEGAEVPGRRTANVRELLEGFEQRRLDPGTTRAVERVRDALLSTFSTAPLAHSPSPTLVLEELLLLAYPDRLCKRRESDPASAKLVEAGGVRLPDPSAIRGDLFLALDVRQTAAAKRQQADVRLVAMIEDAWLERDLPQNVTREEVTEFDDRAQRVLAVRRRRYRDLVLSEERGGPMPDPAAAEAILRERFAGEAAAPLIDEDEVLGPLFRRGDFAEALAAQHARKYPKLPSRQELVWNACSGAISVRDVRETARASVADLLRGVTGHWLERMAPEAVTVPSGNRIRLDWTSARPPRPEAGTAGSVVPPVLAVRLQELFGLPQTPRVGNGALPVLLHILGPSFRPVQVTTDLASFWRNTYPQVRKELRARYPKHSWPDDPLAASPVRGTRRRKPD